MTKTRAALIALAMILATLIALPLTYRPLPPNRPSRAHSPNLTHMPTDCPADAIAFRIAHTRPYACIAIDDFADTSRFRLPAASIAQFCPPRHAAMLIDADDAEILTYCSLTPPSPA